jgi:hypothetical protein
VELLLVEELLEPPPPPLLPVLAAPPPPSLLPVLVVALPPPAPPPDVVVVPGPAAPPPQATETRAREMERVEESVSRSASCLRMPGKMKVDLGMRKARTYDDDRNVNRCFGRRERLVNREPWSPTVSIYGPEKC